MKPVNIEKVVTAEETYPLLLVDEKFQENDSAEEPIAVQNQHKELELKAYKFAEYSLTKPNNNAFASKACKYVYPSHPLGSRCFEPLRQDERTCFAMPIPRA